MEALPLRRTDDVFVEGDSACPMAGLDYLRATVRHGLGAYGRVQAAHWTARGNSLGSVDHRAALRYAISASTGTDSRVNGVRPSFTPRCA